MRYKVTAWLNEDLFTGPAAIAAERFKLGLSHQDYATRGPRFEVEAKDEHAACEVLWAIGNRMSADLLGEFWPPNQRSLSMGDVCQIGESAWLAVAIGWKLLEPERFAQLICTGNLPPGQTDEESEALEIAGFCPSCSIKHPPAGRVRVETEQQRAEMEAFLAGMDERAKEVGL